jgi:hypothetical protein
MAQRQPTVGRSQPALPPSLAAVKLHAAGLDVGADAPDGAVPPSADAHPGRGVGADPVDVAALADWLAQWCLTTVALESTGVSWLPLVE